MEQWKHLRLNPVFQVSNYGNVRRNLNRDLESINEYGLCEYLKRYNRPVSTKHSSGNEIIQGVSNIGGRQVAIRLDKVVYQYFVNDVDFDKYDIIYKDGDKSNCHFNNLGIKPKTSYLNRAYTVYKRAVRRNVLNSGYKKCSKCKDIKQLYDFYFHTTYNKHMSQCKSCKYEYFSEYQKKYNKEKYKDPFFRLMMSFRHRTTQAIKQKGYTKKSKTKKMLGCEWEFLKEHLENQFAKGMTWDNYGEWHVDHIIPISMAETEEQLYKLSHYTNLQPLWGVENISKNDKLPKDQIDKAKSLGLTIDYSKII